MNLKINPNKRVIGGLTPSNHLHIGNYIGGLSLYKELQQKDYDIFLFVSDLHGLSPVKPDYDGLWDAKIELARTFLASGIDTNKITLFYQSDVHTHAELSWVLTTIATMGELSKMTQYKDKSQKAKNANGTDSIPVGLFEYPVLMAADILLYDVKWVYVGIDQKQHVELCRNLAQRFNKKFGNTFVEPECMYSNGGAKILDLLHPEKKMSKTTDDVKGSIFLLDNPTVASKKIMGALTDNLNQVKYDPEKQPGIANLINIYVLLTKDLVLEKVNGYKKEITIKEIENKYKSSQNYGIFKKDLAKIVFDFLTWFQQRYEKTDGNVASVLKANASKCLEYSQGTLDKVYRAVGLLPKK